MADLTEACKGECKGHPFNCYNHPTDCGCAASIGELGELARATCSRAIGLAQSIGIAGSSLMSERMERTLTKILADEVCDALSRVQRATIEECAKVIDDWARFYSTELFAPIPEEKRAKDGVFADALREMMPKFSAAIRTLGK